MTIGDCMKTVSVVIPVYNVEKYLPKCIDSVINQTYQNLEIILVDDGSTDSSGVICDKYAQTDSRIKVIHQANSGQGSARNNGMDNASGEYLIFVDSDDYIHPQLTEKSVEAFELYDTDIVLYSSSRVDEDGNVFGMLSYPCNSEELLNKTQLLTMCAQLPSPTMFMVKLSVLRQSGVTFTSRVWYEDLRTIPKWTMFINKAVKLDAEPMYYYLNRTGSTMNNGNVERLKNDRIAAIDDLYGWFKANNYYQDYKQIIDWICIYHGFVLPNREVINFDCDSSQFLDEMREYVFECVGGKDEVLNNPHVNQLSAVEKLIFTLALRRQYTLIKLLAKLKSLIK